MEGNVKKHAYSNMFYYRVAIRCIFSLAIVVGVVFFKWQISQFHGGEYIDLTTSINTITRKVLKSSGKLESQKLVLFYTPLFGRTPWPTIENDYQFTHWNNVPCKVQKCRISYDKQDLNTSDAVIFHGQDMDHLDLVELGKTVKHRTKQRWLFFLHENPLFFTKDLNTLKDVFNWTMTYKFDSDIFVPYSYYFPKTAAGYRANSRPRNYGGGKDRLVAWLVSHCGKQRDKLVRKLMNYIPVHVYGACAPSFSQNRICERRDASCRKTLRRYKFYLAFENSNCIDYITEKYWITSLQNDIVPVVLGGGNYSDRNLAVPGSFINVLDFVSVKDLADYLIMLDKNDKAYNEYFSWKNDYYVDFPSSWTCQLCAMLNNDSLPVKWYDYEYFKVFWGREYNCGFLDAQVDKLISEGNITNSRVTAV